MLRTKWEAFYTLHRALLTQHSVSKRDTISPHLVVPLNQPLNAAETAGATATTSFGERDPIPAHYAPSSKRQVLVAGLIRHRRTPDEDVSAQSTQLVPKGLGVEENGGFFLLPHADTGAN